VFHGAELEYVFGNAAKQSPADAQVRLPPLPLTIYHHSTSTPTPSTTTPPHHLPPLHHHPLAITPTHHPSSHHPSSITPTRYQITATIQKYWGNMARYGNPNGPKIGPHKVDVLWPQYNAATDAHLRLSSIPTASSGLMKASCDFLDSLPKQAGYPH
jgi:carboxylesterase type B